MPCSFSASLRESFPNVSYSFRSSVQETFILWKQKTFFRILNNVMWKITTLTRGGSRTTATSKMELFVIIVNSFQPLTIITKCSVLDVASVLDPPLLTAWLTPWWRILTFNTQDRRKLFTFFWSWGSNVSVGFREGL